MIHVRAGEADGAGVLHDHQTAGLSTEGALGIFQGLDHDEIWRAALAFFELLRLLVGELRRQPVSAVGALEGVVSAGTEAKLPAITCPRHVRGFTGAKTALLSPVAEHAQGGRGLAGTELHAFFQVR